MRDERADFPVGKVIRARYIVEELLGKGGFGAVYRVRERSMSSNIFALKEIVDPNQPQRERFTFEGEILQRLAHPALPRVYHLFEDRKRHRLYMLMDYIEGVDLEQLRQQQPGKRFALAEALRIMAPIVDALIYLHAQEPPIIHRDIKPANIIVSPSGDKAVLVDFGIAKEYDQDATTTAVRHCSPGYGAPEQYALGTNPRTDIYGLAATFYKLVTGQVPVDAFYRLTRLGSGEADPLEPVNVLVPTIPPLLAEVLRRAMAINSDDRFASIEEFWRALQAYPGEQSVPELVIDRRGNSQEHASQVFSPAVSAAPALSLLIAPERSYVSTVSSGRSEQVERRRTALWALVALVLVGLISGTIFGAGLWSGLNPAYDVVVITPQSTALIATPRLPSTVAPSVATSPLATASPTLPPTTIAATPTPAPGTQPTAAALTPVPTARPTVLAPTPVPTARPAVSSPTPLATPPARLLPPDYPLLANRYDGSISDQFSFPSKDASLVLSQIRQDGEKISGNFSSSSDFIGAGSFSGTLSADKLVQFILPGNTLLHPFFFQGRLQADGSMLGTYCSLQNNHCNFFAGEYGNWQVMPLSR